MLFLVRNQSRVFPRLRKTPVGSEAKFRCLNDLNDVQWYHNRHSLPEQAKPQVGTAGISITATIDTGGHYYCYGFDRELFDFVLAEGMLIPIGELLSMLF